MKTYNKRNIATSEMNMLRGILGVSRLEHIRHEEIRRLLNPPQLVMVMWVFTHGYVYYVYVNVYMYTSFQVSSKD